MLFTIITPCFNSFKTLRKTYDSLLAQTYKSFEWILVDDCSNDGGLTRNLIDLLKEEAPFPVKTHFLTENYFGSRSTVIGCELSEGQYACVLDHDDQLLPNALEIVKNYIEKYSNITEIIGVCGRCVNENGYLIGERFYSDCFVASEGVIRFKHKITSELFQFSKIEVIKPLFNLMQPGYTNGFVWSKLSENYLYVYVNDVLRIYDTAIPTSFTNTTVKKLTIPRYPHSREAQLKSEILSYRPFLKYNILLSTMMIGSYLKHAIICNRNLIEMVRDFDIFLKLWCFILYPFAYLKSKVQYFLSS